MLISSLVQIPEDQRESYSKGQHLRGADAQIADRARAEIVRAQALPLNLNIAIATMPVLKVGWQFVS